MTVATATYKVGDTYTSQKSKVTGTILEIVPTAKDTVRVKLDVNGSTRWTNWKAYAFHSRQCTATLNKWQELS